MYNILNNLLFAKGWISFSYITNLHQVDMPMDFFNENEHNHILLFYDYEGYNPLYFQCLQNLKMDNGS